MFNKAILDVSSVIELEFLKQYFSGGKVLFINPENTDLEEIITTLFDDYCGYRYEEIATVL